MNNCRNIVIIAGQNSVGKTTTFNVLTKEAKQIGIPYYHQPFSDLFFMLNTLKADDKQGGLNHYHEWCAHKMGIHTHDEGQAELPFIITDNKIIDEMFSDFFSDLAVSSSEKLLFAEWTGGRNINPAGEPASGADFSFERIGRMLQEGRLPTDWLDRVRAVIHVTAKKSIRYALNEGKHTDSIEEIITGTISPKKGAIVLDIFGEDDFLQVEGFLQNRDIHIYPIENDGTCRFYEQLREVSRRFFTQIREIETQSQPLSIG
jgi:hypothetical protein